MIHPSVKTVIVQKTAGVYEMGWLPSSPVGVAMCQRGAREQPTQRFSAWNSRNYANGLLRPLQGVERRVRCDAPAQW